MNSPAPLPPRDDLLLIRRSQLIKSLREHAHDYDPELFVSSLPVIGTLFAGDVVSVTRGDTGVSAPIAGVGGS